MIISEAILASEFWIGQTTFSTRWHSAKLYSAKRHWAKWPNTVIIDAFIGRSIYSTASHHVVKLLTKMSSHIGHAIPFRWLLSVMLMFIIWDSSDTIWWHFLMKHFRCIDFGLFYIASYPTFNVSTREDYSKKSSEVAPGICLVITLGIYSGACPKAPHRLHWSFSRVFLQELLLGSC